MLCLGNDGMARQIRLWQVKAISKKTFKLNGFSPADSMVLAGVATTHMHVCAQSGAKSGVPYNAYFYEN